MTKNISAFLPSLPITKQYYPEKNQNTICKIIKVAAFLLALPFLLIADLLYAAFYARSPLPHQIIDKPLPPPPLPEPDLILELPLPEPEPIEPSPEPIAELPPDSEELPAPEPAVSTLPESTDPVIPPLQEPSIFARVAPLALGILGVGAFAYLFRSYGQTSLPSSDNLQEEKDPSREKPGNFYPSAFDKQRFSLGQSLIRSCDANFNISTCRSPQRASPFAHSSLEIDPKPILFLGAEPFGRQQSEKTPQITPLRETSPHRFDPNTLNNIFFGQCSLDSSSETDSSQNLSIFESSQKAPPFAHFSPAPISLLNAAPSFVQPLSSQQGEKTPQTPFAETPQHCFAPHTSSNIFFGPYPLNFSYETSFPQGKLSPLSQNSLKDLKVPEETPQNPSEETQMQFSTVEAAAYTAAGLTAGYLITAAWDFLRNVGVNPAPEPESRLETLPSTSLPTGNPASSVGIDFNPRGSDESHLRSEVDEQHNSSPSNEVQSLANLQPERDGLISISLNLSNIKKLILGPNDLQQILWAVELNNRKILEIPFPCEIERVNENGRLERVLGCSVTPSELLKILTQSRSLDSEDAASSEAISQWIDHLSNVHDSFCIFTLNDQNASRMYVQTETLIDALKNQSSHFECFLKPRHLDQFKCFYNEDLKTKVAAFSCALREFLSEFPLPLPEPSPKKAGSSSDTLKSHLLQEAREKEKYNKICSAMAHGHPSLSKCCYENGISPTTFARLKSRYGSASSAQKK